jgi:hypothetical protein
MKSVAVTGVVRAANRGPRIVMFLALAIGAGFAGCVSEGAAVVDDPAAAGSEQGGKADDVEDGAVTLGDFVGRYVRLRENGEPLSAFTLRIDVNGDEVRMYRERNAIRGTDFRLVVGAAPIEETFTSSSEDWFSGSRSTERRRSIETLDWLDERTLEYRHELWSWPLSIRIWEDWTWDQTTVHRLTLNPDGSIDHYEIIEGVESEPTIQHYVRQ